MIKVNILVKPLLIMFFCIPQISKSQETLTKDEKKKLKSEIRSITKLQKSSAKEDASEEEKKDFYYFEIPSIINGSNLSPFQISGIESDFKDKKLSAKLGFPNVFNKIPKGKKLSWGGYIQGYVQASGKETTLLSNEGNNQNSYGGEIGVSFLRKHKYWRYDSINRFKHAQSFDTSSERVSWFSVIASSSFNKYVLLNKQGDFNSLIQKNTGIEGNFYLAWNNYFYSEIPNKKRKNHIFSIAVGYARISNYNILSSSTHYQGILVPSPDSSEFGAIAKATNGKLGELKFDFGLSGFMEYYYPVYKSLKYGGVHLGGRVTAFSTEETGRIFNGVGGIFINIKGATKNGEKAAKDVLGLALIGEFKRFNAWNTLEIEDRPWAIKLQVGIPLIFN